MNPALAPSWLDSSIRNSSVLVLQDHEVRILFKSEFLSVVLFAAALVAHTAMVYNIQWNLDLTKLYKTKSSVKRTKFSPSNSVMYEKEPRYNEPISPVPWHFVKSRFHCMNLSSAVLIYDISYIHI